jgi:hypothetical protein
MDVGRRNREEGLLVLFATGGGVLVRRGSWYFLPMEIVLVRSVYQHQEGLLVLLAHGEGVRRPYQKRMYTRV